MFDDPRLLFANDWFYTAFSDRDMTSMARLWAQEHQVTCLHPGWQPLIGRDDVLASWEAILGNPDAPVIQHSRARAFMPSVDLGYVICYESINDQYLIATNIFVLENQDWRMAHHQAAPSPPPEEDEDADQPATLQ